MARAKFSTVNFGSSKTGLLTVGYTLYNVDGSTYAARATTGVVEFGVTGVYGASISVPTDRAVLTMWDTGEASPRYGSEDNNIQVDSIEQETSQIRLIWNSIRNQGEFFATLMDKLGLIEKNRGIIKQDMEAAVAGIRFPATKEINMPDMEPVKASLGRIEKTASEMKMSNDSRFAGMNSLLTDAIGRLSESIRTINLADSRARASQLISELQSTRKAFAKIDAVMEKIENLEKAKKSDANEKSIEAIEKKIMEEIRRLKNILVNTISMVDRAPQVRDTSEMIRMFGGKK